MNIWIILFWLVYISAIMNLVTGLIQVNEPDEIRVVGGLVKMTMGLVLILISDRIESKNLS